MNIVHAVVLGIIQGLSEFLPISSSAHLALVPWLLHWEEPGLAFDVALHTGTLVAVLVYFRSEWMRLLAAAWDIVRTRRIEGESQWRVVYLVIATIPGGIAGVMLDRYAETTFRAPELIAWLLIALGIVLWIVDRAARETRPLSAMRPLDALLIGIAQIFALLPGVSRSGSTITAGLADRFDRESAAVFSFLMSMPIIFAAALFKVPQVIHQEGFSAPLIAGVVASAVSGWLAISALLRYVKQRSYGVFVVYRILVGIAVLLIVHFRA